MPRIVIDWTIGEIPDGNGSEGPQGPGPWIWRIALVLITAAIIGGAAVTYWYVRHPCDFESCFGPDD